MYFLPVWPVAVLKVVEGAGGVALAHLFPNVSLKTNTSQALPTSDSMIHCSRGNFLLLPTRLLISMTGYTYEVVRPCYEWYSILLYWKVTKLNFYLSMVYYQNNNIDMKISLQKQKLTKIQRSSREVFPTCEAMEIFCGNA